MGDKFTNIDEKAFDYAVDTVKQIITLSTAVLASSVLIAKEFMDGNVINLPFLTTSWLFFLLSIVSGVWAMLQLTTTLIGNAGNGVPTITNPRITKAVFTQLTFFILGLGVLIGHGVRALW